MLVLLLVVLTVKSTSTNVASLQMVVLPPTTVMVGGLSTGMVPLAETEALQVAGAPAAGPAVAVRLTTTGLDVLTGLGHTTVSSAGKGLDTAAGRHKGHVSTGHARVCWAGTVAWHHCVACL